ncbi:MAG: S8 family serine peptidase [Gemmatimonadaceae bacterium]|nr:S8 family serine peptidase [Gemmatimonadaceae bacterium]
MNRVDVLVRRVAVVLLSAIGGASCTDNAVTRTPFDENTAFVPVTATAAPATTGFAFLSPTVRVAAVPAGTFDASRTPTVRIRCVTAVGPTCPTVRTLVMGSATSDIRVNAATSEYRVSWTSLSTLEVGSGKYAIDVVDGATVLGTASVRVSITTRDALLAADNEIAIIRGKPVVISFRITTVPVVEALVGLPDASAVEAVPDRAAVPTLQDFNTEHPVLQGIPVSINTAIVRLRPTATIGETNALLAQVEGTLVGGSRGIAGRVAARLILRFATTTHAQLEAKLVQLRASTIVLGAVPDAQLSTAALPRAAGQTVPSAWAWNLSAAVSGNWALKTALVPQLWNFNRFTRRRGVNVLTGVWETGTIAQHADIFVARNLTPDVDEDEHALVVASVIAARHNNGGIDGVSPFAQLVTAGGVRNALTVSEAVDQIRVWTAANVRVVNASIEFTWPVLPSPDNALALAFIDVMGATVKDALARLQEEGARLPVFVVAAGNNSTTSVRFPTALSGPLQNAGTRQGAAPIIVVEALRRTEGVGSSPLERLVEPTVFSAMDGHIAAGGQAVMTATAGNTFSDGINGTSVAAPLVTGIVSYLMAIHPTLPAPTLTTNRFLELLQLDALPVTSRRGVAANSVDAFAAILAADQGLPDPRALRALIDIDDGSFDGNQRVDVKTLAETLVDSVGGDDRVSMRDFRRWRDWQLDAEGVTTRALNGRADHPARDLNLDGTVSTDMAIENVYPRGDFNGDGRVSATLRRGMPVALGGTLHSDLEVMQRLFTDSVYTSAELPALLRSSDIEVRTAGCIAIAGAARTVTRIFKPNGTLYKSVTQIGASGVRQIFTIPEDAGRYRVSVEAQSSGGATLASDEDTLAVQTPGADALVEVSCALLTVSASGPTNGSVGLGSSVQVLARFVDAVTGASVPAVGAIVTVTATNGSVSPSNGTTTSNGTFTTSVTPGGVGIVAASFVVQINGQTQTAQHSFVVEGGTAPPPRGLSLQIVSGFQAGTPTSPIRYRARVTNIPGSTIVWTATASSNGAGFLPAGPAQGLISSVTFEGPIIAGEFLLDNFATLTYLPNTRLARGITINMRACVFVNGVQVLQTSGQPFCTNIASFFP